MRMAALLIHQTRSQQGNTSSVVFIELHDATTIRLTMSINIAVRAESVLLGEVWTPGGWTEVIYVFAHDRAIDYAYDAIKHADSPEVTKRARGINMSHDAAFDVLAAHLRTTTLAVVNQRTRKPGPDA